jgi:hypothetical protein
MYKNWHGIRVEALKSEKGHLLETLATADCGITDLLLQIFFVLFCSR